MTTPDDETVAAMKAFAVQQASDAAGLRIEVRRLERDNARLLRRLNRVYDSWTWRAGRVVLFPYYATTRILRKLRHLFRKQ